MSIRMVIFRLLALLAALLPVNAAALSCRPPDAVRTYKIAAASEKRYLPVHGRFHTEELQALGLDKAGGYIEPPPEPQVHHGLRFTGAALTRAGFTFSFDSPIDLRLSCIGPWCPGKPGTHLMLAFLEVTETGYLLDINACGAMTVVNPGPDDLERVVRCHQGGECAEKFPD